MIDPNDTLGHLATVHPEATNVFLRHRLDFCCGGGQKLSDACRTKGLDAAAVASEIAAAGVAHAPERWDTRPLKDLIQFIVSRYHEPLRLELPALVDAARRVERVHRDKPSCPHGLAAHLQRLDSELRQHMAKEEMVLFPAVREGTRGQQLHMPIRVMMQEHQDHGENLRRTRELTANLRPPREACATWRALYVALEKLESELMEHIHLESNVLFPRALSD
jgi:regulator of cell morphogenesis and NO signaling